MRLYPFIKRVRQFCAPILDNEEFRYAVKHGHDGLKFQGIWQCDQVRDGVLIAGGYPESPNVFTTEGIARLLNIMFHDIAKDAAEIWYVGIFKNNVTPAAGDTAAAKLGAAGTYGECQDADYDDPATNRPAYTTADTATASITNAVAGKAAFTMAGSFSVYGAFLTSTQPKTDTAGYLMCAKKFTAARSVIDDDILYVTYALSVTSS